MIQKDFWSINHEAYDFSPMSLGNILMPFGYDGVNGFVCPRQDVDSLANALEQLITNPALRQQMGEAGYQRYKELYTLEAFEKRFVELLSV